MCDADVPARLYLVNICIQVLTCKYAIHGDCSFEGGLYAELASFSNRLVLQTVQLKLYDICFCFCTFISGGCGCFVGKIPYCPPFLEIIPPPKKMLLKILLSNNRFTAAVQAYNSLSFIV